MIRSKRRVLPGFGLAMGALLGAGRGQTFWRVISCRVTSGPCSTASSSATPAPWASPAPSLVSGHVRGLTNTLPLHVEILYNKYHFAAAFAVASLLALLALITLVLKSIVGEAKR